MSTPPLQNPCWLCERAFVKKKFLLQHVDDAHGHIRCHSCDKRFTEESLRRKHAKEEHSFICDECEAKFSTEDGRRQHKLAKHGEYCNHCFRKFVSTSARDAHVKAKHAYIHCVSCSTLMAEELDEHRHIDTVHPTLCWICYRFLGSPAERDEHVESEHSTGSDFPFVCRFCPQRSSTRVEMLDHRESHSSDFECAQCKEGFYTKEMLRMHVRQSHNNNMAPGVRDGVTVQEADIKTTESSSAPSTGPMLIALPKTTCSVAEGTSSEIPDGGNSEKSAEKLDATGAVQLAVILLP